MTQGPPVPAAVRVGGWGWRYSGRAAWAVRDLTLRIEPGERVLLLGASGAGKSTVLAGLAGVLGGDDDGEAEGTLAVAGRSPAEARGTAGLLLQDPDAQVILARVGDDVAFACENLGVPRDEIWPRVRAALDAVGLAVPLDHPTTQLSGGQKQRLALAGILAMRPGLLLLDEPTANLDPDGVREVRDAVAAAATESGATLVVVEHRVAVWREVVDRVIVLAADGGVLADGTPDAVLADASSALRRAGVWLPGEMVAEAQAVSLGAPLLTARELAFGRGPAVARRRRRARAAAVGALPERVSLDLAEGSAVALTGRNGAGKSTLALTLGGLLPVLGGTLRAEATLAAGADPAPQAWRSRELLTRIGSVFQNPEHQFVASTVRDELTAGPRALGLGDAETRERVDELLERLTLTAVADANPFTLSGGQKRRLSVGTALATRPRLLVLDEPTFGQDANTWRGMVRTIAGLRAAGHAIVTATHDAEFVSAIGAATLALGSEREVAA
ncbi:ABC transporter ATP-binding protein [Leifsonia aquatica]|uniref:ABC transporter ATP-binding protein n=1 Tax=Leifsonia aquatica TaxID=144185 RepID=UPI001F0574B0|nr:ABC transporter ATP-binding protein [Leifsonia aquatica]